ncbi:M23 family metallopeptidase [Bacillus ndiopicus]|uniref:M23 family metallopeptidase n=1 Tax=Bacillus ndiopicus TaxID=1347368 RepID=UPI0005A64310|nr:M23 family metallopeptidase [Bacillus ndiopicus]
MRNFPIIAFILLLGSLCVTTNSNAQQALSQDEIYAQRMSYYYEFESPIVPWYYIAAIDQYERNIQAVRKDIATREGIISIQFPSHFWSGPLNPSAQDTAPSTIAYFAGNGQDGNNDGVADPAQDADVLRTLINYLHQAHATAGTFQAALEEYYENDQIINQIHVIAGVYKKYNTVALAERAFPIPVRANYSYKGTWGASRGWGGRRTHEGTDLFASYGTPVHSTSYGAIEVMGWNDYGGWRIGIRDVNNTYHYYAHLSSFHPDLAIGDIVGPGTVIGYVGSSGYGKEGTSGKFPPHLHYGMYKFDGRNEWAFDPFPSLLIWERQAKKGD